MGNRPAAVLQRLLDPKMGSPAVVFRCVRRVSGVLAGLEKDAGFPASLIHWLGPLGRVWAPLIMSLHYFVLDVVMSLGFCTLIH